MATYIVTGKVGGGKTYLAVEKAIQAFSEGRIVHSNLPWAEGVLEKNGWAHLHVTLASDPTEWVTKLPDGTMKTDILVGGVEGFENLVFFDESAYKLHAMDQAEAKRRNRVFFELTAMSRQTGIDYYFIVQDYSMIDKAARNQAAFEIFCIDLTKFFLIGQAWGFIRGRYRRAYRANGSTTTIRTEYARFDKLVASSYNTYGFGDAVVMKRSFDRKGRNAPVKPRRLGHLAPWLLLLGQYYYYSARPPVVVESGPSNELQDVDSKASIVAISDDGLMVDSAGRLYRPGFEYVAYQRGPGRVYLTTSDGAVVTFKLSL